MEFPVSKFIATLLSTAFITAPAMAQMEYKVIGGSHQPAATNVEKATIIAIRCEDGHEYYIYSYFRATGPNYRAIEPPHWGSPIGGKDYMTYEDAVHVACYT